MIINYILQFIESIVLYVLVHVASFDLPQQVYDSFGLFFGYWNSLMDTVPYIYTVWLAILVIFAFELGIRVLNFFLGSHNPVK